MPVHDTLAEVTDRIVRRSRETREAYVSLMDSQRRAGARRRPLPCANHAHGVAAASEPEKHLLARQEHPNIGIVTAYNDMLSAHQPYGQYPARIQEAAARRGATAQVARAHKSRTAMGMRSWRRWAHVRRSCVISCN